MNPLFRIISFMLVSAFILLFSALMLVGIPYLQLQEVSAEPELKPYTVSELKGREQYISLGCVYCHSQQPRDPRQAPDGERGWGRPSTPGDYGYDYPHLLGTMRTGPDLLNVGKRLSSSDWHLGHLYQPRAYTPGSIMPSYPFLFERREKALAGETKLQLPAEYAPKSGVIIAKQEALDLVAYLLALDRTYPSSQLPMTKEKTRE
jgi:cytochrome c oxidase cbb3-type subunit 2